jgi:sn-glycerol 3-phosphate transport system ATP-binding protein
VREAARVLEISDYLNRKPRELSGGQRQRVAMGRAIVRQPKAFLFDEPLSNLDAKLRVSMRVEIRKLQRAFATTSIYVTHDQLEAMTLADMLVVMNAGVVEQIGAPLEVYERPASTFVAAFIGAPPMNLLQLPPEELTAMLRRGFGTSQDAILGIRPEDLELATTDARAEDALALPLTVEAVERVGPESFVYAKLARGGDVIVRVPGQRAPDIGQTAVAVASREKLHLFDAATGKRLELPR